MSKSTAVILCVYCHDNLEDFKVAIDSILNQTLPCDLYIYRDGPVGEKLQNLLDVLSNYPSIFILSYEDNYGLAYGLNCLIDMTLRNEYKFIARMDSDDISEPRRLEKQVDFLDRNPNISVVGSDVIEINSNGEEKFYKKMDCCHDDMSKKIIKKCPFNHPSVMFRATVFEEGYRYKSYLKNTQDYYLWVDLLAAGKKFSNINEPLLKFRVNDSFHSRRGLKKAFNDFKSRHYAFNKLNVLTIGNVIHVLLLLLLRLSPKFIKKLAYNILR